MTVAAGNTNGWAPMGAGSQLPAGLPPRPLTGAVGLGQFMVFTAAGGVTLVDGVTPGLIPAGVCWPAKIVDATTFAADATAWDGLGAGAISSTITNDGFTAVDVCAPAWGADGNTLGKLSNYSGSNRSLMGLVFGLDDDGTPRSWVGPVAQTVARGLLLANGNAAALKLAADVAASTATSETQIPRQPVHAVVTAVTFTGDAAITASDTTYATITVYARDLNGANQRTIATGTTQVTGGMSVATAFKPASLTLSGTVANLNLLETDVITYAIAKASTGVQLPASVLRVVTKVI